MAQPVLIINGVDYSEYIESLTPSRNGLNAEGSGRDVQTGLMFRTKIADKQTWEVKLLRISESVQRQLASALKETFYNATVLDPETGARTAKTFYTDTLPFGVQRYNKSSGTTFYDGMTFKMTER